MRRRLAADGPLRVLDTVDEFAIVWLRCAASCGAEYPSVLRAAGERGNKFICPPDAVDRGGDAGR
jgi:hypothetical protein